MAIFWSLPRADDDGVLGVHDEPYAPLGSQYHDTETGFTWQYLKAFHDLNFGDAVMPAYNLFTITDLDTAAAAGSTELNHATFNSGSFLTNLARVKSRSKQKELAMLQVTGSGTAGAIGQRGIITEIQAQRLVVEWLTDDGSLGTALPDTSDIEIFADWLARKSGYTINDATNNAGGGTTNAADVPTIGFVQQPDGVKQDEYFWALYCGKGTFVAGSAVSRGNALVPQSGASSGAGRLKAAAKADGAANDINRCGTSLVDAASGNTAWGNLKATMLIGEVPVKTDIGYQASTVAPPATGSA